MKRLRSSCPINYALEILGDRWTLLLVRDLLLSSKRHFRELATCQEGIASNVLADRLKKLEGWGLVARRPDPDNGRQVVYELTDKGLDLTPALVELTCWSAKYDPRTAAPKALVDRIKRDKHGYATGVAAAARKRRLPA